MEMAADSGVGARGARGIRLAFEQQRHHHVVAAAGGAQQRRAALGVDAVHRQAELKQAQHRLGIAGHRRGRQVGRL
jgi:hypothetical protein